MEDYELLIFWLIMSLSVVIALYNWISTKRFKEFNRLLFEFSEGQEYYFDKLNTKIIKLGNEVLKLKKQLEESINQREKKK
jgi:hypothetical protein